ncbi:MAG: hypothetical protein E7158_06170 [Firmicutes bacterium]|nr:hypothetical protein [Bacillota bacterium]
MSKKYKIILGIIIVVAFVSILVGTGYFIYKYNINKNSAEVIIVDKLSINYLNGRKFNFDDREKNINFSVINDGEKEESFYVTIIGAKTDSKNISYELYEGKKKIVESTKLLNNTNGSLSSILNIKEDETKSYKFKINNPDEEDISFEIEVQPTSVSEKSLASTILNDNQINKEAKTKVGEEAATSDEGLILDIDDNGSAYYFRGNVTNNYVSFANKMWRIIRVNGNGSVRLILDSDIPGASMYDSTLTTNKLEHLKILNNLKVYSVLEKFYEENLKKYDDFISSEKYCIDVTYEGENLSNYLRINSSNIPTFNCHGTRNNSKIGLITIDEIIYAGATVNTSNEYFYLKSENVASGVWTLSPFKETEEGIYYYELSPNGSIQTSQTGDSTRNLRPVINIKKNTNVTGKGTKEEPYIIEQ